MGSRLSFILLLLLPFSSLLWPSCGLAQDAIRVQSNEVLVPTVVFDNVLFAQLNKMKPHHRDSYGHLVEKNEQLWDSIAVKGLTQKDFRLLEDGVEQKVQRVKLEPPGFRVVNDNLGKHPELVGSGGGLWAYPDTPRNDMSMWMAWPQYVLAFIPAKSAPGSCHQIRVEVERKNTTVWARSEYCNTEHPASDPLSGTDFGKQMEEKAKPETQSDLDLKMKVWSFADAPSLERVYVSLEFPWQALAHEFRDGALHASIGTLVMVYAKDGTLAARFSDFACCDYGDENKSAATEQASESHVEVQPSSQSKGESTAGALIPDRYETQFGLPPGEYKVRAVLSDGLHFGVQEAALTVASYDASKLGISDVVLSRRMRKEPPEGTEKAVAGTYTALVSKGVEFTPTANTAFWPSDMLFAYFEIYDPLVGGQPGAKVQVNMKIVEMQTGAEAEVFAPVDTTSYSKAGSPVIAVARGIVLKKLTPGAYRLEVQASGGDGKSTEWRPANFSVMEAAPLEMK